MKEMLEEEREKKFFEEAEGLKERTESISVSLSLNIYHITVATIFYRYWNW